MLLDLEINVAEVLPLYQLLMSEYQNPDAEPCLFDNVRKAFFDMKYESFARKPPEHQRNFIENELKLRQVDARRDFLETMINVPSFPAFPRRMHKRFQWKRRGLTTLEQRSRFALEASLLYSWISCFHLFCQDGSETVFEIMMRDSAPHDFSTWKTNCPQIAIDQLGLDGTIREFTIV
ncbi:hypothetical protein JX265_007273 [Neoarthrinium moseri]|uniref:Uncharacterized protein n=1 Tax=Neoarthrinium moseri TaxID=1658444 RepID=A0A9Q0AN87_9PEZI|nr:hypothetical protein JX265_007273 [Neoarthrinium moseri]